MTESFKKTTDKETLIQKRELKKEQIRQLMAEIKNLDLQIKAIDGNEDKRPFVEWDIKGD